MIVHTRWAIDEGREFKNAVPCKEGYRQGSVIIPMHAVSWVEDYDVDKTPAERKNGAELHKLTIMSALDGMGGKASSKEQLFKAVGGNRTKFFAALQVLIEAGSVRSDGRRIIVVET